MAISLTRTADILKYVGEHRREGQVICGFAMETKDLIENATKKLVSKNVDLIVANNLKVAGAGFGTDTNVVTLIKKEEQRELPKQTKDEVAKAILDEMLKLEQQMA
jgi:phosphopantothenoylcysteine decarboxylase/phosphopantothenate--cysteine ligase